MKDVLTHARSAYAWLSRHLAAGVALLLIIAALIIGYVIGNDAPDDEAPATIATAAADDAAQPQMYTCAMHPTVRLPDPDAKCPICFMDLIPVTDDRAGEGNERRITISESAAATSRIEIAEVGRFFPSAEVRLFGKVTYDETSVARLTAYFPGRIERLFVNYLGVPVAKSDHIAELYSPELLAAFAELRQARLSERDSAEMSTLVREATLDTLRAVREKLRLFGLTAEQIESIESGEYDSDRLTIYAPIGGIVTHLAVREGDYVETGNPIATVADLSRLWLDLEAYESQLPLLRWGQPVTFTVEAQPGEVFEGRVSFIEPMVDERTRTAAVRVAVDNTNRRLKPGMFATAVVRPRVGTGGAVISDELAGRWVCPMHPTIVRNQSGQCDICGMDLLSAESLGVVGDPASAEMPLVVPRTAVLFTGKRSVVYVQVPAAERPTYEVREVMLGPRAGEFQVVRSGLSEGESVVVNGAFRLDSAMQIAAKSSMMSPGGGGGGVHEHGGASAQKSTARHAVPDAFRQSLKPLYAAYLDAQEHLADDDLGGFNRAADDLKTALRLVEEPGLVGEPLAAWRRAAASLRIDRTITTLDDARTRFETMSKAIIDLQRRFGHHGGDTWHLAFCPMAFDNKGAFWMQRGEIIDNPYFGESMLRCGDIREEFPPLNQSGDPATDANAAHQGHDHE